MWAGVAALYTALFLPTWALAAAPAPAVGSRAATLASAGAAVAWIGLWLEVTADICKAVDKMRNPQGCEGGRKWATARRGVGPKERRARGRPRPDHLPPSNTPPPLSFSSGCVYRICRQPNLLGELLFWAGSAAAGAPALAAGPPLAALAAAAGLAAIVSIVVGDSQRKTEEQSKARGGNSAWAGYAAAHPPLWPLPRSGPV